MYKFVTKEGLEKMKEELEYLKTTKQKELAENLILRLATLAEKKGAATAIEEAKDMDEPYVLDRLHDVLAQPQYRHLLGGK